MKWLTQEEVFCPCRHMDDSATGGHPSSQGTLLDTAGEGLGMEGRELFYNFNYNNTRLYLFNNLYQDEPA